MIKLDKKYIAGICVVSAICLVGVGKVVLNNTSEYKDGTYRVECNDFDKQGWKPYLEMTFKDGAVVDVEFNYNNKEDGRLKTSDDAYNARMMAKVDMNPRVYTKEFSVEILVEQSMDDFDGVSGASHSTREMKVMGPILFEKAKKGDTSVEVIPLIP